MNTYKFTVTEAEPYMDPDGPFEASTKIRAENREAAIKKFEDSDFNKSTWFWWVFGCVGKLTMSLVDGEEKDNG